MIAYFLQLCYEILPVFLIAVVVSAIIDKVIPDSIFKSFSKNSDRFSGILAAAVIGSLLPMCTCGMIPLVIKLREKGIKWKFLTAFLVAGNANSIPAMILTVSLGIDLVVLRFVASILYGLLVTYILAFLLPPNFKLELQYKEEADHCCDDKEKKESKELKEGEEKEDTFLADIMKETKDMIISFMPWIMLAILLAVAMEEVFEGANLSSLIVANPTVGPFFASIISFPFYFCAGTDIPLVKELIEIGIPIGTAVAFMMASPGINLTSFFVYRKAIGFRPAVIFVMVSIVATTLVGLWLNVAKATG